MSLQHTASLRFGQPLSHFGFSPLPHSLHSKNVDVCLFAKEESSKVKEMLKAKGVTVKKVCMEVDAVAHNI